MWPSKNWLQSRSIEQNSNNSSNILFNYRSTLKIYNNMVYMWCIGFHMFNVQDFCGPVAAMSMF